MGSLTGQEEEMTEVEREWGGRGYEEEGERKRERKRESREGGEKLDERVMTRRSFIAEED